MILVFGATGFSGRMIAEQLRARGLPVRAAARDAVKLEALASELPGIETATADVADPASLTRAAEGCSMLISSVGPYTRFGEVALRAAIDAGIPYIDIAGEPGWLRRVFAEFGPTAAEREVALLAAFGYDYVPGNLGGALLLDRCGERAVRIDVGYCLAGKNPRSTESFSRGTLDSLEASSGDRGFAFADGKLGDVSGPRRKHEFDFDGNLVSTVAIGGSEHFTLPRLAPWLEEVNVGLGWFEAGTARVAEGAESADGPTQQHRDRARAQIVARAHDASGAVIDSLRVDGPNPYDMSGLLCGWAGEVVLGGHELPGGALGPVDAFGLDLLTRGCAEIGLTAH